MERKKHRFSFGNPPMGESQSGSGNFPTPHNQKIQIQSPGGIFKLPHPTKPLFNLKKAGKKLKGGEGGFEDYYPVPEMGLFQIPKGRIEIEGGSCYQFHPSIVLKVEMEKSKAVKTIPQIAPKSY
jgi:hypothetical protein